MAFPTYCSNQPKLYALAIILSPSTRHNSALSFVIRYGNKRTGMKMSLEYQNITDAQKRFSFLITTTLWKGTL